MGSAELLVDAFGRVREEVHAAVEGLNEIQLGIRLDTDANSVAWLIWHLARIQDDHLAGAFGVEQVWPGFKARFGLTGDEVGYGHSSAQVAHVSTQVARVQASAELLTAYHDAVHELTIGLVSTVTDADLERIVDTHWNPPVTLGVRLVSVISDCLQHVGQAAFVRGILLRR
jgi:hypothetical protein